MFIYVYILASVCLYYVCVCALMGLDRLLAVWWFAPWRYNIHKAITLITHPETLARRYIYTLHIYYI